MAIAIECCWVSIKQTDNFVRTFVGFFDVPDVCGDFVGAYKDETD
jgi:hypothetical protein